MNHRFTWMGVRAVVVIQCAVSVLVGVFIANCSGRTGPMPVSLVVSGDTNGWITPCGCTSNQSGGLLRRATFLKGERARGLVLYADAGGAPAGTSAYQRLRFESILGGEREMGIIAHNIGGPEAALGSDYLRDVQARTHVPLISANLRDAGGNAVAPALVTTSVAGRRFGFIGVLSPRFAVPGIQIAEPLATLREAIASHKADFDTLIVLAYLPDEELEELAAALPEADAVIGGPTGQSIAPKPVGPTILAAATRKGKFLVKLDFPARTDRLASGKITGSIVELTPNYGDDPGQLQNLQSYFAALKQADFHSDQTDLAPALVSARSFRIAGSESCFVCHTSEAQVWQHSAHARAWNSLTAKRYEVDPSCQQCHTTGYGLPGGFVAASGAPKNVGVGCENCHGPSQAHVNNPKIHTPNRAADQCIRCHDAENSPAFVYAAYWPKIQHGRSTGSRTAPIP